MANTINTNLNNSSFSFNLDNYSHNNSELKYQSQDNYVNATTQDYYKHASDFAEFQFQNKPVGNMSLDDYKYSGAIFDVIMSESTITAESGNYSKYYSESPKSSESRSNTTANPAEKTQKVGEVINKIYSGIETVKGTVGSTALKIGETFVDFAVMAGGTIASKVQRGYGAYLDHLGFEEDAKLYRDSAEKVERFVQGFVEKDFSSGSYDDYVKQNNIDEEIAYSNLHTGTAIVTSAVGYGTLSLLSGGTAGMVTIGAVTAGGNEAQKAFQNGATFNQAAIATGAATAIGGGAGLAMGGLSNVAQVTTSIPGAIGMTAAGAATGAAPAVVRSGVEYATYGKNQYDSYAEYAKANGVLEEALIGAGAGGIIVGGQSFSNTLKFNSDIKKAGLTREQALNKMATGKDEFIYGTDKNPNSEMAMARNAKIAKTTDFKKLNQIAVRNGKTLQEYAGISNAIDPDIQAQANVLAAKKIEHAKEIEPKITGELESLQSDSRQLTGLDHRLKGQGSLSAKIARDSIDEGITLEQACDKVSDSVRYTMICDEGTMVSDIDTVMTQLKADGYTVPNNGWKNSFGSDHGYKGLNVKMKTPDGDLFELQFHTVESFSVKDESNHTFYEIARNKNISDQTAKEIAGRLNDRAGRNIHLEEVYEAYPKGSFEGGH